MNTTITVSVKKQQDELNKDRIAYLISNLRSGNFPQVKGVLHDPKGFCCLGVASHISKLGYWGPADPANPNMETFQRYIIEGEDDSCFSLCYPVRRWYGFSATPTFPFAVRTFQDIESSTNIAELNDSGVPFNQIADLLEFFYIKHTDWLKDA